jgi:flagellar basal body-associated protein FliL
MAEEKDANASGATAAGGSRKQLLLPLFNTLLVLGVLGMLIYTRLVFKRPAITEQGERTRLAQARASPTPVAVPGTLSFDPVTVNIASTPNAPHPADGTAAQIKGKLHYATVGITFELRDIAEKERLEKVKPVILDQVLQTLGHKSFGELITVQGRYVLRTQLMELANQLVPSREAAVTNVYFTHFVVQ